MYYAKTTEFRQNNRLSKILVGALHHWTVWVDESFGSFLSGEIRLLMGLGRQTKTTVTIIYWHFGNRYVYISV